MPLSPSKSHTVHFSWALQSVRDSQSREKSSFHLCSCFTFLIHVFTPKHTIWVYSCICLSTSLPACSLCDGPSSTSLIALFLPHHTAEKQNELYHSRFKICCRTPIACRTEPAAQSCPYLPLMPSTGTGHPERAILFHSHCFAQFPSKVYFYSWHNAI